MDRPPVRQPEPPSLQGWPITAKQLQYESVSKAGVTDSNCISIWLRSSGDLALVTTTYQFRIMGQETTEWHHEKRIATAEDIGRADRDIHLIRTPRNRLPSAFIEETNSSYGRLSQSYWGLAVSTGLRSLADQNGILPRRKKPNPKRR